MNYEAQMFDSRTLDSGWNVVHQLHWCSSWLLQVLWIKIIVTDEIWVAPFVSHVTLQYIHLWVRLTCAPSPAAASGGYNYTVTIDSITGTDILMILLQVTCIS